MPKNIARVKIAGTNIEFRQGGPPLADIIDALGKVKANTVDLKPVWQGFQPIWQQQEARVFAASGIPAWPALSPAYAARKAAEVGPQPILVYSGRLRASLAATTPDTIYRVFPRTLQLGTNVPYAIYNQERRPHVVMLPETWEELLDLVRDYLTQPLMDL